MNRESEPVERAHFQLTVGDLGYLDPKYRVVSISDTDCLTQTRTVYGDIAYANSWCRFKHPRSASSVYATWREQIKTYIIACLLDLGHLTELQVDSIVLFARSLLPVKNQGAYWAHQKPAPHGWYWTVHPSSENSGQRFSQETADVKWAPKG